MIKNKKTTIGIAILSIVILIVFIGSYKFKTKHKNNDIVIIHKEVDKNFDRSYIDNQKKEIEEMLGEYEIYDHDKADEKTNYPERFYLKYKNNEANEYFNITIMNRDDMSVKEQINEYTMYSIRANIESLFNVEPMSRDNDIIVYVLYDEEKSHSKPQNFSMEKLDNSGLYITNVGIYFKKEKDFETVKKKYEDKFNKVYDAMPESMSEFTIAFDDENYIVTKQSGKLNYKLDMSDYKEENQ